MRRLIILLLAVIVPIKAWAGIAQPHALKMSHAGAHLSAPHTGAAGEISAGHADQDQSNCCDIDETGGAPHMHECAHLAMPLIAAPPLLVSFYPLGASAPVAPTSHPRSVVLDVLLQPPLLLL